MKTKLKLAIIVCSLLMLAGGIGCAALSHYVTPAEIDKPSVDYVVSAGVSDANEYTGYPNLVKATKLKNNVDVAHEVIQFGLQHQISKDNLDYSIHRDTVAANYTAGLQREERLFGEKGLLALGLSLAGFGTLTGFLGLLRRKPGDISVQDAEQAVAQAVGKTTEELSEKQKQFLELVKGIQVFINENKDGLPTVIKSLKSVFDKTQDTNTQVAVAAAKKLI